MSPALAPMLVLLWLSASFSGTEAALFTLASRAGARVPAPARGMLRDPAGSLTVILLGNLMVNLGYFAASAAWAARLRGREAAAVTVGAVAGVVLFGEILPKILAHRRPAAAIRLLLPPVWLLHLVLGPAASRLGRRLAPREREPEPVDPEAVDSLLAEGGPVVLPEEERRLLRQVLELGTLRAGALRRPLAETAKVEAAVPLGEARRRLMDQGVAWGAVLAGDGEVRGILDLTRECKGATAGEAMWPVPVLPEVAPVARGVELLRSSGAPFVLLVDEYGDSAGIIERGSWADTLLDRIPDSPAGRLPAVVPLGQGRFQVDASLPLHVFAERFGDPGPCDPRVDTLGGLVQERLGRVPRVGDRLHLGDFYRGVDLAVIRCEGARPMELELRLGRGNDGTPYTHPRAGTE